MEKSAFGVAVGGVPAIASMLGSSVSTVKTHLEHIFKRQAQPDRQT